MRFESDDEETETLDVFYKLAMLTADRASGVLGIRSSTFKKRCAKGRRVKETRRDASAALGEETGARQRGDARAIRVRWW